MLFRSAFFGVTGLPEFNKPGATDLKELPEIIKSGDWQYLNQQNELAWEYICDNLLLSDINKLRIERILANL